MKTIRAFLVAVSMVACFTACSKPAPQSVTAESFISDLSTGLKENDLPYDYDEPSSENSTYKEFGDCTITKYTPALGIIVQVTENEEQTALNEILIYADTKIATRNKLSSAAFSMSYLINSFDPTDGQAIYDALGMGDISTPGVSEAEGTAGRYKFMVSNDGLLYLTYTPSI